MLVPRPHVVSVEDDRDRRSRKLPNHRSGVLLQKPVTVHFYHAAFLQAGDALFSASKVIPCEGRVWDSA